MNPCLVTPFLEPYRPWGSLRLHLWGVPVIRTTIHKTICVQFDDAIFIAFDISFVFYTLFECRPWKNYLIKIILLGV